MSVSLEDNKRTAIAVKLADMKAMQNLLISNDQALITACPDRDISNRLESLLQDDQKNLEIIDTAIVQYGIKAEPRLNVVNMIKLAKEAMVSSNLSLFEKVAGHELINHSQALAGLLIHKAAQIVGADIAIAISPLNTVNYDNRSHQEQLKGIMEMLSTVELTGQEADQSLWAKVQDAIAIVSGMTGGIVNREDEMTIRDLIRIDQVKVTALFKQLQNSNNPRKLEEYFGQLYKDLTAHAAAVEEVLYPLVRHYHDEMQNLYDEQAKMKLLLNQIKDLNPQHVDDFKTALGSLMTSVQEHVIPEENAMFSRIQDNLSDEQEKRLATEFKVVKSKIQDQRLACIKTY
ncbi:hemerythrin domain-containing protein [Pseudanabaena yagii]|uniref:DNA nickase n=1 Tax=Pseudanabaena yagii GIHE-NHR1 TaxID=2722753 RepID=A0ABX1LVJ4_9CYAN|nr:hemerythrin domain-containing protein [Pseudanabaena yagii]NMF60187.1 DNA nickase [Pseudanabaena yagii GIHE-NHR1]